MKIFLDLHIHSRYSRACSPDLELPKIATACERKGIDIVATGDFTHPRWFEHIKENLEEERSGIYRLSSRVSPAKRDDEGSLSVGQLDRDSLPAGRQAHPDLVGIGMTSASPTKFILSTEVSCIYKHKDKTRRVHHIILAPSIEAVAKFNKALEVRGVNIRSDGRPIMGLSSKEILRILLEIDERFFLIPAHIWTPWFSVFGSKSGYDTLEECFEELTPYIKAGETGLSSDPPMNRRLSMLDNITLVSNSDAHSLNNLGREANVFDFADESEITYGEITRIIKEGDKKKFLYTVEFYPEEGKYHFDGHAVCEVCLSPRETKANKLICPKCKKQVTVGVLHRVDDLADRGGKEIPDKFIPHKYAVPLKEIIADVFGVGAASKKVRAEYDSLIKNLGSEFEILLDKKIDEIEKFAGDKNIALALANMRSGNVKISPGYDGVFGLVDVIPKSSKKTEKQGRLL